MKFTDTKPKRQTARQLAVADDERRKAKMLARLRLIADDATLIRFSVADRKLLPEVEDLNDWPAHHAPTTEAEMGDMERRLREFMAA